MGSQQKQLSNSATGFSNNFMSLLQGLLTGGTGGANAAGQFNASNPFGSTMGGASGILQNILSPGAGQLGGALATQLAQSQTQNVDALRERYGAFGGTSLGSPASSAEAQYRAYATPQITSAIGNLQLGAISPLLNAAYGMANRGVTQPYLQPSAFTQFLQGASGVANLAGSVIGAANGVGGGGGGGGAFASTMGNGYGPVGYMSPGAGLNVSNYGSSSSAALPPDISGQMNINPLFTGFSPSMSVG